MITAPVHSLVFFPATGRKNVPVTSSQPGNLFAELLRIVRGELASRRYPCKWSDFEACLSLTLSQNSLSKSVFGLMNQHGEKTQQGPLSRWNIPDNKSFPLMDNALWILQRRENPEIAFPGRVLKRGAYSSKSTVPAMLEVFVPSGECAGSEELSSQIWSPEEAISLLEGKLTGGIENTSREEKGGVPARVKLNGIFKPCPEVSELAIPVLVELTAVSGEKRSTPALLMVQMGDGFSVQEGKGQSWSDSPAATLQERVENGGRISKAWAVGEKAGSDVRENKAESTQVMGVPSGSSRQKWVEPAGLILGLEKVERVIATGGEFQIGERLSLRPVLAQPADGQKKARVQTPPQPFPQQKETKVVWPDLSGESTGQVKGERLVGMPAVTLGKEESRVDPQSIASDGQGKDVWRISRVWIISEKSASPRELFAAGRSVTADREQSSDVVLTATEHIGLKKASLTEFVPEKYSREVPLKGRVPEVRLRDNLRILFPSGQRVDLQVSSRGESARVVPEGNKSIEVSEAVSGEPCPAQASSTYTRDELTNSPGEQLSLSERQEPTGSIPLTRNTQSGGGQSSEASTPGTIAGVFSGERGEIQPSLRTRSSQEKTKSGSSLGGVSTLLLHGSRLNRPVKGAHLYKSGQTAKRALQANVISQIVQNARMLKLNARSEVMLRLKPEHLGKVSIKLTLQNSTVSANLSVENSEVKKIISANLPQLRESLLEEGIQVENFNISVNSGEIMNQEKGEFPWGFEPKTETSALEKGGFEDAEQIPWLLPETVVSLQHHLVDYIV